LNIRYSQKILRILYALSTALLILTGFSSAEEAQRLSTKTAVIFNTLCAKCHEGECSGRLSFDTGSEKARTHIQRYAEDPTISKQNIEEFFTLLNHMKKSCEILMPDKGTITVDEIAHFATPSQKAYFVPLGLLSKGSYVLSLSTKEKQHYRIEILSEHFDPFLDLSVCPGQKKKMQFTTQEPVKTFLRIRSTKPLHILSFKLSLQQTGK